MNWIAAPEKDTAAITLENRLWDAADQLRADSGLYKSYPERDAGIYAEMG
jgi:hypothetical protein